MRNRDSEAVIVLRAATGAWLQRVLSVVALSATVGAVVWSAPGGWRALAQTAAPCVVTVSPRSVSAPPTGGTLVVAVIDGTNCSVPVENLPAWVTSQTNQRGQKLELSLSVKSNMDGEPRRATVTVGDVTVSVSQAGPRSAGTQLGERLAIGEPTIMSPGIGVKQYAKFEIVFDLSGVRATRAQWPFDAAPPRGIPAGEGISVHAEFVDPRGRRFQQPAFYAERFLEDLRDKRDWHLATGEFSWHVRFTPTIPGVWKYRLIALDKGGSAESPEQTFTVEPSEGKGFIRVSERDSRYFEFDTGAPFHGLGFEIPSNLEDPAVNGAPLLRKLSESGVNLVRVWISDMYGSAWNGWVGGRGQYRGYLPVTGLTPFIERGTGRTTLAMKLDYEPGGDQGWFEACRGQFTDDPPSVKPFASYRIRVRYAAAGIVGPRHRTVREHGLVAKLGGFYGNCYEVGTSTRVTGHGGNTSGGWGTIEGTWNSGTNNFLPRMHLALENVLQGEAYVDSVSVREDLRDGSFGPEVMVKPSMEYQLYIPEEKAHALDEIVAQAERNGVYLKLVVMEKNDKIFLKMSDDGGWAAEDNVDGFYGTGRTVNQTRWLQQAWWRYLQARWGYSSSIHSWELTNEGDPFLERHYQMTDEFGKFMHCRVFGVEIGTGDGQRCTLGHPNSHLVTTSFWHSVPDRAFWANRAYPNVDYADVHAYVSTTYAPAAARQDMSADSAEYHLWHSRDLAGRKIGKPVMRGEAGLDVPGDQSESVLGLDRDTQGVWLHNYLWASLDSGGLYEIYWWTTHIWTNVYDHRPAYRAVSRFLADVPLNAGGYVDWAGTVSNSALRVVGQKHADSGRMHLWVQNRHHTWKDSVDGKQPPALSGDIVVPGFRPNASYVLERWDTYAPDAAPIEEPVVADPEGRLRLRVSELVTDFALKVRPKA